jgi:hypothetical protein
MNGKYIVSKLFQEAFGINTPIFIPWQFTPNLPPSILYDAAAAEPQEYDAVSVLNTPVLFPVSFEGGTYQIYTLSGDLEDLKIEDFTLPYSTLLQFRRAKNITRTNVLGSSGTVKEIFGFDDWVIDVKGLCLNERGIKAGDTLSKLLEWEKIASSVRIKGNQLFNQISVGAVAINDWSHQVLQGQDGAIAFQFTMYSDVFMELNFIGD